MKSEYAKDRKVGLEEAFFQKESQAALERLRQCRTIKEAIGVDDGPVVQSLLSSGMSSESIAALFLTPLVRVAWADGEIHERERKAVLQAAIARGIGPETPAYDLIESWLGHPPDDTLENAWNLHIRHLCKKLSPSEAAELRSKVLGDAQEVAMASGGFMGLGSRLSGNEQRVIDSIGEAFQ